MSYRNKWIPAKALAHLEKETGSILDIGGGAAPYVGASHIVDVQPYEEKRLTANAWPGEKDVHSRKEARWSESDYTQLDLCSCERLPFEDSSFDLGLCSHVLEDLRDPVRVVTEALRVCRKIVIISPSRFLEQMKGVEHPRYAGFYHHLWMVYERDGKVVFRRKTPTVNLRGCHLSCPLFRLPTIDAGCFVYCGSDADPAEEMFWSETEDAADLRAFVHSAKDRPGMFQLDSNWKRPAFVIWKLRQALLGCP